VIFIETPIFTNDVKAMSPDDKKTLKRVVENWK